MKILKGLFAILLFCALIISCKDSKKEEQSEAVSESVEEISEVQAEEVVQEEVEEVEVEEVEIVEDTGFSYTVNYPKDGELAAEVDATIRKLISDHPSLESEFEKAHGYAVFPQITKAGLGVGGAGGKGLVFENDQVIGGTKLMQATLGLQAGAQQYSQVMFFENKAALDNFTNGKFKFSSEASAVALKSGVSANMVYNDGIAAVVESEKGAMAEASLGTQKFKFDGDM
ncbi:YSC84-related protein [Algibacter mikhailovii]|uniref:lipid-binding SYLF domain-containing protein n=1 Tax=Algibacter mikhailovii TaxID=425498 RepID=UPI0024957C4A|nr:YSC84-related protein [Algibacter mikhailovii]